MQSMQYNVVLTNTTLSMCLEQSGFTMMSREPCWIRTGRVRGLTDARSSMAFPAWKRNF